MKTVSRSQIEELCLLSRSDPRRRKMLNLHKFEDHVQRMFNAIQKDAYFRPHVHLYPDKTETMYVVQGAIAIFIFSEDGSILQNETLGSSYTSAVVDIPRKSWHTICALRDDTVVFEVKEGPYNPETDKIFAEWAPEENSDKASEYLQYLQSQVES
jgi:cupin fold WbuC family metalloprotein